MQLKVSYANYSVYESSQEHFRLMYKDEMNVPNTQYSFDKEKNEAKFERVLNTFDLISTFFELVCKNLFGCLCFSQDDSSWDKAWSNLWLGKSIKIVKIQKVEEVKECTTLFQDQPIEVSELILKNLDAFILIKVCTRVSKMWYSFIHQEKILGPFLPNHYNDPYNNPFYIKNYVVPKGYDRFSFFKTCLISNKADLVKKIESLFCGIQLGQHKLLQIFPFGRCGVDNSEKSEIRIDYGSQQKKPNIIETVFVVNLTKLPEPNMLYIGNNTNNIDRTVSVKFNYDDIIEGKNFIYEQTLKFLRKPLGA